MVRHRTQTSADAIQMSYCVWKRSKDILHERTTKATIERTVARSDQVVLARMSWDILLGVRGQTERNCIARHGLQKETGPRYIPLKKEEDVQESTGVVTTLHAARGALCYTTVELRRS